MWLLIIVILFSAKLIKEGICFFIALWLLEGVDLSWASANQDFNNIFLHISSHLAEPDLLYLYQHAIDNWIAVQIDNTKPATLNNAMAATSEQVQYFHFNELHTLQDPNTPHNSSKFKYFST